jgi:integrase
LYLVKFRLLDATTNGDAHNRKPIPQDPSTLVPHNGPPPVPFAACSYEDAFLTDPFGGRLPDLDLGSIGLLPNGYNDAIPKGVIANGNGVPPMDAYPLLNATDAGLSPIGKLSAEAAYFVRSSRAPATRKLYRWAWSRVLEWCRTLDRCPLPMSDETAALVLVEAAKAQMKLGTIRNIRAAICIAHRIASEPDPTRYESVRSVLRGIARALGDRPHRKTAFTADDMRLMRDQAFRTKYITQGNRDWALISIGYSAALRRSEIAALDVADLEFRAQDLIITIQRSKTDQLGRSSRVHVQRGCDPELCPVVAVQSWLGFVEGPGPLFRPITAYGGVLARRLEPSSVAVVVKRYGDVLGLSPEEIGAHSLRAGLVTSAVNAGVPAEAIMAHTRHKSHDTLQRYYRPREPGFNMTQAAGL